MAVIAFCGSMGSGKDTAADYLVNYHGYRRDSFASTLKDAVAVVFGWDRTMLEGRTAESRKWREKVDPWWAARLDMPALTPRWVLQYWGTDVCRLGFHDDIWIASLENKIRKLSDNIVITDVRFPNEISAIRNAGGVVVQIQRGIEPEWHADALAFNRGPSNNMRWALGRDRLEKLGIHASETAWIGQEFDYIITNNSSIDDLFKQIEQLLVPGIIGNQVAAGPGQLQFVQDSLTVSTHRL